MVAVAKGDKRGGRGGLRRGEDVGGSSSTSADEEQNACRSGLGKNVCKGVRQGPNPNDIKGAYPDRKIFRGINFWLKIQILESSE